MSVYKVRKFETLPGVFKAAARTAWRDAKQGDGYLYKTLAGSLVERIPTPEVLGDEYIWDVIDPAGLIH